jgi:hypothetical protein
VRLPRSDVPDEELALTGRGPRTELTHQVPDGRAREVVVRAQASPRFSWARAVAAAVASAAPRAGVVALVLAVLAVGLWLGTRWGSGPQVATGPAAATADRPTTSSAPRPAPPPEDDVAAPTDSAGWKAVLDDLYERRARAFAEGDVALLDGVYTVGSPLRAADERAIADLAAAGQVLRGFAPVVVEVADVQPDGGDTRLAVTDRWPEYFVVAAADPMGTGGPSVAGRGEVSVRMTLVRAHDGWRIDDAERLG